jgi:hypothetical protein
MEEEKEITEQKRPEKTIEEVSRAFEEWRSSKEEGGRVPEELWETVLDLSNKYSRTDICRKLGINYRQYRKCVQKGEKECGHGELSFVELGRAAYLPEGQSGGRKEKERDTEYQVEIRTEKGDQLRLHVRGGLSAEIVDLWRATLRGGQ